RGVELEQHRGDLQPAHEHLVPDRQLPPGELRGRPDRGTAEWEDPRRVPERRADLPVRPGHERPDPDRDHAAGRPERRGDAGHTLPAGLGSDDAPGAMLPNGHVVFAVDTTSPLFTPPTKLYDFDPVANTLTVMTTPSALTTALNGSAFVERMLMLPNGDMLMT